MLEYYDRKLVKLEEEIKEVNFIIENIKFGFENGIIKSKKIYEYHLETYTIKRRSLEDQQDDYHMKMVRLKPLVIDKAELKGNVLTGGVV